MADFDFDPVPNVWLRPNNKRREADAAKALLTVPDGDHLTLLNVYNNYIQSNISSSFLFLACSTILFILQICMTKTGLGQIIFRLVHWRKPTTFGPNFSARWSGLKSSSFRYKTRKSFGLMCGRRLSVDFSCRSRIKKGRKVIT